MSLGYDRLLPSYFGNRPDRRPGEADYWLTHAEELPSLQQVCEFFEWWLTNRYHARPSRARHMRGQTPAQLQADGRAHPLRPALTDVELYHAFLRPLGTRSVGPGGALVLDGRRYTAPELRTVAWMGQKVLAKVDPYRPETLYVFDLQGAKVCEATRAKLLSPLDAPAEEVSGLMRRERRQLGEVRERAKQLTGGARVAHPAERLALLEPGYQAGAPELAEVPVAAALPEPAPDADLVRLLDEALYERPAEVAEEPAQVVAPAAPVARETEDATTDLAAFLAGLDVLGERGDCNHDDDGGTDHADE
jgi:hypothetical protein